MQRGEGGGGASGVLVMVVSISCIETRERLILSITWRFLSDHHSLLSRREKGNLSILPMFARVSPVIGETVRTLPSLLIAILRLAEEYLIAV